MKHELSQNAQQRSEHDAQLAEIRRLMKLVEDKELTETESAQTIRDLQERLDNAEHAILFEQAAASRYHDRMVKNGEDSQHFRWERDNQQK